jgi:hypothetical protein
MSSGCSQNIQKKGGGRMSSWCCQKLQKNGGGRMSLGCSQKTRPCSNRVGPPLGQKGAGDLKQFQIFQIKCQGHLQICRISVALDFRGNRNALLKCVERFE